MDKITIDIFLQSPEKFAKRMKLQHILGALVLTLMGVAFLFINFPALKLIGLISTLTGLLVFYFLLPRNSEKIVTMNRQLRLIEITSFLFLSVGFFAIRNYFNAAFMILMAIAYSAMLYVENQTSAVRQVTFDDDKVAFDGFNKHFEYQKNEIHQIHLNDKYLTLQTNTGKIYQLLLAQEVDPETQNYLESKYI